MFKLVESEHFTQQLEAILSFIAEDKVTSALKFAQTLKKDVNLILEFPYMAKTSCYHDKDTFRDLTFMQYTIIYFIDSKLNEIVLLEIFNKNLPLLAKPDDRF